MKNQNPKDGWNYRVVREDGVFTIRKVYYENSKIIGLVQTASPLGTTLTELKDDYLIMHNAFSRPVLRVKGSKLVEIKTKR